MFKKYILTILFLGILIVPNISSATSTIEELTTLLNSLLAQVVSLQQQITQQTSISTEWCYTFNSNLKYGNTGSDIKALEIAMSKEGFFDRNNSPKQSFYFGEKLASAVVGFQQKYKLEILTPWGMSYGNGYVGKTTRKKLNLLYGCRDTQFTENPITSTEINGSCGSSHLATLSYKPTSNLCLTGTASHVSVHEFNSNRYSWTCNGIGAGATNSFCYSYIIPKDIDFYDHFHENNFYDHFNEGLLIFQIDKTTQLANVLESAKEILNQMLNSLK